MTQAVRLSFEDALTSFRNATASSMEYARLCANMAYEHFRDTGDVVYAERFVNEIDNSAKNYVRKTAFLKWLAAHAPVRVEKGRLFKDKSDDAIDYNDKALEISFWDFAPEKEAVLFGPDELLKALSRTIGRFRDEKHVAKDESALDMLNRAEKVINGLKQPQKLAIVNRDTSDEQQDDDKPEEASETIDYTVADNAAEMIEKAANG